MKKVLITTAVAFALGVGVYNFLPTYTTIHQSGTIPLSDKRQLINDAAVIVKGTVKESSDTTSCLLSIYVFVIRHYNPETT
ncbi:hypothetical protein ACFPYJ_32765 [Paenibacillus solisilvae]|uniref:Uncharacterized protein n=1 Tax=Paenibacillus solisilvae TaxID=2486751 RepID=A0ABW0W6H4_9BACL